ncbi:unnamed protein product, partial [Dicrocoelium dendriticum]
MKGVWIPSRSCSIVRLSRSLDISRSYAMSATFRGSRTYVLMFYPGHWYRESNSLRRGAGKAGGSSRWRKAKSVSVVTSFSRILLSST